MLSKKPEIERRSCDGVGEAMTEGEDASEQEPLVIWTRSGRHWQELAGTGRHWQALSDTGR